MNDRDALIREAGNVAEFLETLDINGSRYTGLAKIVRALISLASPSPAWPEDEIKRISEGLRNRAGAGRGHVMSPTAELCIEAAELFDKIAALATLPPPEDAWKDIPAHYAGKWSYEFDERRSVFFVCCNGYRIADAEDSEVAHAICLAHNNHVSPPPEDERVKGLVEALEAVMTACRFVDEDSGQIQSPQELQDAFDAFISASPQPEVKP